MEIIVGTRVTEAITSLNQWYNLISRTILGPGQFPLAYNSLSLAYLRRELIRSNEIRVFLFIHYLWSFAVVISIFMCCLYSVLHTHTQTECEWIRQSWTNDSEACHGMCRIMQNLPMVSMMFRSLSISLRVYYVFGVLVERVHNLCCCCCCCWSCFVESIQPFDTATHAVTHCSYRSEYPKNCWIPVYDNMNLMSAFHCIYTSIPRRMIHTAIFSNAI